MAAATLFPHVAFIGLGNMGSRMAANLLKKGHRLSVFDVHAPAAAKLKALGATVAASPADAARGADAVVTMLPSSPHVRDVFERDGVFEACRAKRPLLVDSSTIDPAVSRALAERARRDFGGMRLVDAPVSGGVGGAEAGTLTFMVGAEGAGDFEAARPLLEGMGKNIVRCGGDGTGQVAKLCNNLVLAISMSAVSEAMNLGVNLGADAKVLAGVINSSSGRCWSSDTYNPVPGVMPGVPSSRGYSGGFGSALMAKDLGLALDAARAAGAPLPTGSAAAALYAMLLAHGKGEKDFSVVYEFLRGGAGAAAAAAGSGTAGKA
jgi:3-hydroxyisobutyrate dehydrogenase